MTGFVNDELIILEFGVVWAGPFLAGVELDFFGRGHQIPDIAFSLCEPAPLEIDVR